MDQVEITLREMRYFAAVADELHFGRAAGRLHVAQSALSRTVQSMERKLGLSLFSRSSREVMLTGSGRLVLDEVLAVLRQEELLHERVRLMHEGVVGTLSAAYIPLIQQTAAMLLSGFTHLYPSITIEHQRAYHCQVIRSIETGGLDVGVTLQPPARGDLQIAPLCVLPLVCAVGENHPLVSRGTVAPSELARFTVARLAGHQGEALETVVTWAFSTHGLEVDFEEVTDPVGTVPIELLSASSELVWCQTTEYGCPAGLDYVEIDPPLLCRFSLVTLRGNGKDALHTFLRYALDEHRF